MKFKESLKIESIDKQGWIYVTPDSIKIGDKEGTITVFSFCDRIYNHVIKDKSKPTNTCYIYINGDRNYDSGSFLLEDYYKLVNNIE